jgi:hypothetical protein
MKRWQTTLGEAQDAVTAMRWLEAQAMSTGELPRDAVFLAGQLWGRFDELRLEARSQFLDRSGCPQRERRWFS